MKDLLIVVDWQNDFIAENGALKCPVEKIPEINVEKIKENVVRLINYFYQNDSYIVFTRDWHTKELFEIKEKIWPHHCIQNTWGAQFYDYCKYKDVFKSEKTFVLNKGDGFKEEYSPGYRLYGLLKILENEINDVYVIGVATDFCVKYTTKDVIRILTNKKVFQVEDACLPAFKQEFITTIVKTEDILKK